MRSPDAPATLRTLISCVLGVVVCLAVLPSRSPWVIRPPWRTQGIMDATAFRTGAELVGTPGLYRSEAVRETQGKDAGSEDTESWRIHVRQIGFNAGQRGMQDEEIIRFLLQQRRPTFFTRDEGFYEPRLRHARYSVVYLAVDKYESAVIVRLVE